MKLEHSRFGHELTIFLKGRITAENSPQVETEMVSLLQGDMPEKVVLDAKELSYLSSSGLRILLKLKKECPSLSMVNVSRDVADILQMTGMDTMLDIRRALREISVEGCPCIGKGKNGEVYRLDRDTIVKLYPVDSAGWQAVEQEKKNAKAAFVLGVPTALSYDVVQVGERIGIVFELVDARSLRDVVAKQPEQMELLITRAAELLKQMHRIQVPAGTFPDMADTYRKRVAGLTEYLTRDEIHLLDRMIDSIPVRNTYVHGDYHRGNLMVQGEELVLIDMADSSTGHPLYDVLGVYMLGMDLAGKFPPQTVKQIIGWDTDTVRKVWEIFRSVYFETRDAKELSEIDAMMDAYCWLRHMTFLNIAPVYTEELRRKMVESARAQFFPKAEECMERFAGMIKGMQHEDE